MGSLGFKVVTPRNLGSQPCDLRQLWVSTPPPSRLRPYSEKSPEIPLQS
ncbi:uncharacterized protein G2W53_010064 [Senna tora]|uniref:Uncharacterized protein n=1 Tax=Senna tora TaxID=362788 RepID=A0A834WYL4_9FABA|nr:uncharacterized protein G2W53_010064 [Senna tora]